MCITIVEMYTTIAAAALIVFLWIGIIHDEAFPHWVPTALIAAILWPLIFVLVIIYCWREKK